MKRNMCRRGPAIWPALLLVGLALGPTAGRGDQVPPGLVAEALDQRIEKLEVESKSIREALGELEQATGLRFVIDDAVLELMPYGPRTQAAISVQNMSVRQALERVLDGLALEMALRGDKLVITPQPVLQRMNRRLTMAELAVIEALSREPWAGLRGRYAIPTELRLDPKGDPNAALERAVNQIQGPSALRQLEAATRALGWAWRVEDGRLIFETRTDDIRRRLDQPVELIQYQRKPLDEVLVDLGRRAGVTMLFEPGVLKAVDARERAVDLQQRGLSVRQMLERIGGSTGLRYEIEPDGVRILGPGGGAVAPPRPPDAGASGEAARRWVRISVQIRPGVAYEALVPVEQLPSDVREQFERQTNELLNQTRQGAEAAPSGP